MFNIYGDNMGKEKTSEINNKEKEFTFLFEIIGIICILISLISIARLGIIGYYGMLTFRLFFGDWYFIFLFSLGALGVFFLFCHRMISIKNIRYLGILLILLSLITLTHFSMHNFVSKIEGNKLKNTILLYLDYFKNGRSEMMVGGGLLGCLLFYICYYLLSNVGTVIVCILLIFVGIVFITKLTIVEFLSSTGKWCGKTFGGAFKFSRKIKGAINRFNADYRKKDKVNKVYNVKYLDENNNLTKSDEQNKLCIDYMMQIKKILDHLNIFYQDVTYLICNHISVFFITTSQDINYEVLRISLKKVIKDSFLIRFDMEHHITIIEINNIVSCSLSLKEAVKKNIGGLVLGKDDRNQYVNTKENILIISNNSSQYRYYFASLLLYPHFSENTIMENYILLDFNENLRMIEQCVNKYCTDTSYLNTLKQELDSTLLTINNGNASTIDEYNSKHKNKIKKQYIYINGVNKLEKNTELFKVLEYLLITGTEIGYQFIVGLTDDKRMENELIKIFRYKIILYNNFMISSKLLGYGLIENIKREFEGFLRFQDLTIRLSLLMISKEELDKIKKHY